MKRWLLPASALVLVVTACGAGEKPAPQATEAVARVPGVRAVAARRERAAEREARTILREFVPPPRAHRVDVRPGQYGGAHVLHQAGPTQVVEVADVHGFWSVRRSLAEVAAFLRAHPLRGFGGSGAEYGSNVPHYLRWGRSSPAGSPAPSRFLTITAVALPRRTIVRVDVQVVWVYPRSPSERVPPATSEIVVHMPKGVRTVTDRAKVGRVLRWFDALPISPPGVHVFCLARLTAHMTLSFRSAGGAWLARARVPVTSASVCDPIGFRIGGRRVKPLVDRSSSYSFSGRLQSLLGIHLTAPAHR